MYSLVSMPSAEVFGMNTPIALRRFFPIFSEGKEERLHYLDNAATAQLCVAALDALVRHETGSRANVRRGGYALAERAEAAYENARARTAAFLGANASEIVFTSGATAGINLLALSLSSVLKPGDEIVLSVAEHHSNLLPWLMLKKRQGVRLKFIPVDSSGRLDLSRLGSLVGERCRLLAVTQCSNVTGSVTDLAPLVEAARSVGAQVLVDGAQAVPHGPVDVPALGADYYVFSGHKCFGTNGIGALWCRSSAMATLPVLLAGGGSAFRVSLEDAVFVDPPWCFEAGTPPIAQAVALGAALDWLGTLPWDDIREGERRLLRRILDELRSLPGMRIIGPEDAEARLPIVSFAIPGLHPHDLCQVLDAHGVATRGGTLCAHPLFHALNSEGAVRASLSLYNDERDVAALLTGIDEAMRILR
jgi:cysteine desulfurase/selenocysteine lyase